MNENETINENELYFESMSTIHDLSIEQNMINIRKSNEKCTWCKITFA